jgi:hypothetical protein
LTFGDVICGQGERISHVYFPIDSFVSHTSSMDDHSRLALRADESHFGHGEQLSRRHCRQVAAARLPAPRGADSVTLYGLSLAALEVFGREIIPAVAGFSRGGSARLRK